MTGPSTQGIKTVLHPVSDLATAKAVYAALLGVPPQTDESYYVGFEAAGQHIGLVPGGGPQGMTSPVAYWHVPDIEAKLAEVTAAGATVNEPAHDVGGSPWWPPSPTTMAMSSGCFRTDECRPSSRCSASSRHRASAHPGQDRAVSEKPPRRRLPSMRVVPIKTRTGGNLQ